MIQSCRGKLTSHSSYHLRQSGDSFLSSNILAFRLEVERFADHAKHPISVRGDIDDAIFTQVSKSLVAILKADSK
jgi:hypothetical protein